MHNEDICGHIWTSRYCLCSWQSRLQGYYKHPEGQPYVFGFCSTRHNANPLLVLPRVYLAVPTFKKRDCCSKLDFTKAFDTVEHNTILKMVKHLGFDDKWRQWTQRILGSCSSSILLNGVPGNNSSASVE
jgi:hypothetical protein